METITPTELAAEIWGPTQAHSRSAKAREIRKIARELYGRQHRPWHFSPAQAQEIRLRLTRG